MTKLYWFSKKAHSTWSTENITCTKFYPKQKIYKIYAKFNFSMPSNCTTFTKLAIAQEHYWS